MGFQSITVNNVLATSTTSQRKESRSVSALALSVNFTDRWTSVTMVLTNSGTFTGVNAKMFHLWASCCTGPRTGQPQSRGFTKMGLKTPRCGLLSVWSREVGPEAAFKPRSSYNCWGFLSLSLTNSPWHLCELRKPPCQIWEANINEDLRHYNPLMSWIGNIWSKFPLSLITWNYRKWWNCYHNFN